MPSNIEVKARVRDMVKQIERAKEIAVEYFPLEQEDTFYRSPEGARLKLRCQKNLEDNERQSFLIAYHRPNTVGPKLSKYVMTVVPEPEKLDEVLRMSNGYLGKVEKRRDAFIVKRKNLTARIHLDTVKGLGEFIEFEVIVEADSEISEAKSFTKYLSDHFKLNDDEHIEGAYHDSLKDN